MIIVTPDGVSEAKATNTKAEHCNKSFNRQHKRRPPFQYFRSKTDYVNGGSQSLRRGPAVHHLGDTQHYSITASGSFQQDPPPWNRWKAVLFCISYQSHGTKRKVENPLFYRLFDQNVRYSNSTHIIVPMHRLLCFTVISVPYFYDNPNCPNGSSNFHYQNITKWQ